MKPAKQIIHEIVNQNTGRAVAAGFSEIDRHAATVKKKIKGFGIEGLDGLVDKAAHEIKRKAAQLATGREQP